MLAQAQGLQPGKKTQNTTVQHKSTSAVRFMKGPTVTFWANINAQDTNNGKKSKENMIIKKVTELFETLSYKLDNHYKTQQVNISHCHRQTCFCLLIDKNKSISIHSRLFYDGNILYWESGVSTGMTKINNTVIT